MRYIQAAVSNDDYNEFRKFATNKGMTWSELVETAVKQFIGKEGTEEPETKRRK